MNASVVPLYSSLFAAGNPALPKGFGLPERSRVGVRGSRERLFNHMILRVHDPLIPLAGMRTLEKWQASLAAKIWLALLALCVVLAGCATNPMTGRTQLKIVSADSAISQSASYYSGMMKDLRRQDKVLADDPRVDRVRAITNRLIDQAVGYRPDSARWAWSIEVIDEDKTINAFCMPGGRMAIYTGLLKKVKPSDDELAQVLGHEIAHALADHGAEKMSMSVLASAAAVGVAVAVKPKNREAAYTAATLATLAFLKLPNSRTAETEADALGIELAARAGYSPAAGATLWAKMMKASGGSGGIDFISTHPSPPKRIEALRALEPPMSDLYQEAGRRPVPARIAWVTSKPSARDNSVVQSLTASTAKTFYDGTVDSFRAGRAVLDCGPPCAGEFGAQHAVMHKAYESKHWSHLVRMVMKTSYQSDLSYLYLAAAAEGLQLKAPAKVYASRARELSVGNDTACAYTMPDYCRTLNVSALAAAIAGEYRAFADPAAPDARQVAQSSGSRQASRERGKSVDEDEVQDEDEDESEDGDEDEDDDNEEDE
jgi:Zn-dependent protease with chaperone function